MKFLFFMSFLWIGLCLDVNGQQNIIVSNDAIIATPSKYSNLTINSNVVLKNESTIEITDTLFISGKLINNKNINARICILNGAEITCEKDNNILIEENLICKNSTITFDGTHMCSINAKNVIIEDYTKFVSGYITADNLTINDTLECLGKLGVKTIKKNLSIIGCLKNTNNENIQLYGNVYNHSDEICSELNFTILGQECNFYGDFSCYRISISENCTLVNHGNLTITDESSGNGIIKQTENSYLTIHSQITPRIDALAIGNTIEYTRAGDQILNTNECYNLVISKERGANLILSQNCTINNNLTFLKNSFLNCDNYTLSFSDINNSSIDITDINNKKGIILNNGKIALEKIDCEESVFLPLFTKNMIYAGLSITNKDENNDEILIDSLFEFVTKTGLSTSEYFDPEFIKATWHISSNCSLAKIAFYWDKEEELNFNKLQNCAIYKSLGSSWKNNESIEVNNTNNFLSGLEITTDPNSFFTIGNKTIFLPIESFKFTITEKTDYNLITITQILNNQTIILEKSYDGFLFYPICTLNMNPNNCQYKDFDIKESLYYRVSKVDNNNNISYSEIICINRTNRNIVSFDYQTRTIIYNGDLPAEIKIYNIKGVKIISTKEQELQLPLEYKGLFFIVIHTNNTIIQKRIIL